MKAKKLSWAMQNVVDFMSAGYELGTSGGLRAHAWLQRPGLGRGGTTKSVSWATFHALFSRQMIQRSVEDDHRWTRYVLTDEGRKAATS